jgi:lipoyl(octanoyl) transferase
MILNVIKPGIIPYERSYVIQTKLMEMRQKNRINDTLILLQHDPVLTLGRRGKINNIKLDKSGLESRGIKIHEVNRGGDVTYHGPGQLVGYTIFDIRNHGDGIKDFVWKIEEVLINLLHDKFGINSYRGEKTYTGIWVDNDKIAAFGLYVSHWVTMHGFSFNIKPDLNHFKWINPCGITDKGVTSLEKLLNKEIDLDRTVESIVEYFGIIFKMEIKLTDLDELLKGE